MRVFVVGCALVAVLVGGLACSSGSQTSREPSDSAISGNVEGKTAQPNGSTKSSATTNREQRDASRDDAAERTGAEVAALRAGSAQRSRTAEGYAFVTDGVGALRLEVPEEWEHATGEASEIGTGNWSNFGGEGLASSITASPDLETWNAAGGLAGTYAAVSTALAQNYTDDELVVSGPNDLSGSCEPSARSDYEREPYSGKVQAWKNCGGNPAASYVTLSAAPKNRECVVLLQVAMYGGADVGVGQHVLDTFEADCAAAASYPLASADEQYEPEQDAPKEEPSAEVSCSGFTTMSGEPSQWQAQQFYDSLATPEQKAILDPDGDGFACDGVFSEPEGAQYEPELQGPGNPAYPGAEGCVNPGPCGVNPAEDPDDNVDPETGQVVGDDTPDCATPEQVLASGLCKDEIVGGGSQQYP